MKQPPTSFDPRATREYRELGFKIVKCPVCEKETMDDYFICPTCGWEYDGTTEEDVYSSCNQATVAEYRKNNFYYLEVRDNGRKQVRQRKNQYG